MMTRKVGAIACACSLAVAACSSAGRSASSCEPPRTFADEVADLSIEPLGEPIWTMASDEATFSSPKLVDLNGDGVLDVVQGFGQDTLGAAESSVVATDGATGAELWRSSGHEDLIGTARFAQLDGDNTPDVVIGGRRGVLLALDGATGGLLWQFDEQNGRWFNFYTSQFIADRDGDGVVEVVAANGGLRFDAPREGGGLPDPEQRNLGTTFVLSGADGSVIASLPAPDGREQYMSALVVPSADSGDDSDGGGTDNGGDGDALLGGSDPQVIIGTGGETLPGALWRLPLDALVDEDLKSATMVTAGGEKGIIAAPSFADLTDDCVLDIVVQAFDGTLSAVDGATDEELWTLANPGFETYSSPTLGYFLGDDDVPDVFVGIANGVWPEYRSSDYLLVDGSTGIVAWRETMGTFAPSGFAAVDVNGDGRDEVIFGVNDLDRNTHQLHMLDMTTATAHPLGQPLPQTTFASPWLGDVDGDGLLDLIATESAYQSNGAARVHRFELPWAAPRIISWGGYLGTSTTGVIEIDRSASS